MSADIELHWEWPANRAIENRLLVKVDNVDKQGSGLFGTKNSPSLAASLPDPYVVSGAVINTDSKLDGKSVKVIAPKLEIEGVKAGSYAMFGVVENSICICIVPVASKDADLSKINCPQ